MILLSGIISSCCSSGKMENPKPDHTVTIPGPKAIIYKTSSDYSKLVPVTLSEDKKTIESYPDISDVYYNGTYAYPTQLSNGYFLDNRGITRNVAFINLTYEAYSKLPKTPTALQLMEMIIDADPLTGMYSCGNKSAYKNIELELNSKIEANDFSTFTKIR